MQHVVPCQTDQVVATGRRTRRGPDCRTEDRSPGRAAGAELGRRREGKVGLKAARQQEDPVHGGAERQVPVMERAELPTEQLGPPPQRVSQLAVDGERQVDV
jgi:hypothetical protein